MDGIKKLNLAQSLVEGCMWNLKPSTKMCICDIFNYSSMPKRKTGDQGILKKIYSNVPQGYFFIVTNKSFQQNHDHQTLCFTNYYES